MGSKNLSSAGLAMNARSAEPDPDVAASLPPPAKNTVNSGTKNCSSSERRNEGPRHVEFHAFVPVGTNRVVVKNSQKQSKTKEWEECEKKKSHQNHFRALHPSQLKGEISSRRHSSQ